MKNEANYEMYIAVKKVEEKEKITAILKMMWILNSLFRENTKWQEAGCLRVGLLTTDTVIGVFQIGKLGLSC